MVISLVSLTLLFKLPYPPFKQEFLVILYKAFYAGMGGF